MDSTKKLRNISFCTGSRGLEKGVERTGVKIDTVAYVEIEAFQIWNLVQAMEKGVLAPRPIWSNLKTFDTSPFRNRIHLFTAGYPCQPYSLAGARKGAKDPRHLWPYLWHAVKTVRPVLCFFENVTGHLSKGFKEVFRSLQYLGYTVEAGIFSAIEVGAPHHRERLFILACSNIGELRGCLADTNNERLEGRDSGELQKCTKQHVIGARSPQVWPTRPGQTQYDWEEPRTIESGVGCTVNGYNFRTELLRQFGNGVVEQVAEKAFRELLIKISK